MGRPLFMRNKQPSPSCAQVARQLGDVRRDPPRIVFSVLDCENSAHAQRLDHRKLAIADAIVDIGRSLPGYADVDFHLDVRQF